MPNSFQLTAACSCGCPNNTEQQQILVADYKVAIAHPSPIFWVSLAWPDRFFPFVLGRRKKATQHKKKKAVWPRETNFWYIFVIKNCVN